MSLRHHRAAGSFDATSTQHLPEPARRWLCHSIAAGTPLHTVTEIEMEGSIRLKNAWEPFAARQIISLPHGFIWAADARVRGIPITGFDRYSSRSGEMRWRMLNLIPVMSASGDDITRSTAGRLVSEAVFLPTAFRQASWRVGDSDDTVVMGFTIDGETEEVTMTIGHDGRLLGVIIDRWGSPDGGPFARYPFGVTIEEEMTVDGVTVPAVVRAGWWWGTDRQSEGEFFRARITKIGFG